MDADVIKWVADKEERKYKTLHPEEWQEFLKILQNEPEFIENVVEGKL